MKTATKKTSTKVSTNVKSILVDTMLSTKQYTEIPLLIENRPIDKEHVKVLKESFEEFGTAALFITVIRTSCIDKKPVLYLADGQHSVEACKLCDLPLSIKIVELENDTRENVVKFVATLNNSVKSWSTKNFLKSYCELNIEEYLLFQKTIKETKLTVTDMLYIFLGSGGRAEHKLFKSGNLVFTDLKDSKKLLEAVIKVKDVIPNKAFSRRSLYSIMSLVLDYDAFADVLLAEVAKPNFKFIENEGEFKKQLVAIYKKMK